MGDRYCTRTLQQENSNKTIDQQYRSLSSSKRVETWVNFFLYYKSPDRSTIDDLTTEEIPEEEHEVSKNGKGKKIKPIDGDYFVQILNMRAAGTAILNLDYNHILQAETVILNDEIRQSIPLLQHQIRERYKEASDDIGQAVVKILKEEMEQHEHADYVAKNWRLSIFNYNVVKDLPALNNTDVLKFLKVEGLLAQIDNQPSIIIKQAVWYCSKGHENTLPGNSLIRKCTELNDDDEECKAPLVEEDVRRQIRDDFFYIRIQERPDRMRSGRYEPQELDIYVEGIEMVNRLYNILKPGMSIAVNGIINMTERSKSAPDTVGLEMECSAVELMEDTSVLESDPDYDALVARDIDKSEIHKHVKKMIRSYAPELANIDDIKHALLLQAIGSDPKIDENKRPIRGDLNICLVGDPASGKSTACHYSEQIRPGSVYNQGKGSTAVGLTGGIEQVDVVRHGVRFSKKRVSFGAYLLARDKIVIIDELEKRDPEDYEDISHPMDDWQAVHIRKSGIVKSFSARCGSLHAGNPIKNRGKYDPSLTIYEQTNLPEWLLSRYDLIFIMRSVMNDEERSKMWYNIKRSYSNVKVKMTTDDPKYRELQHMTDDGTAVDEGWGYSNPNSEVKADTYSIRYMRREIMYLRKNYHPICKPETYSWNIMHEFWNKYNKINILPQISDTNDGSNNNLHLPSTDTRKIYTLLRLAEASARLHRRNEVLIEDMTDAIKLVKLSIAQQIPERDNTLKLKKGTISKFVNSVANMAYKQHSEEVKRKATLIFQNFKALNSEFVRSTFEVCEDCRGSKLDKNVKNLNPQDVLDRQFTCPTCNGIGGNYQKFTYQTFESIARSVGVTPNMAYQFFSMYQKLEFFVKQEKSGFFYVAPHIDLRSREIWMQLQEAMQSDTGTDDTNNNNNNNNAKQQDQQHSQHQHENMRGAVVT